MTPRIPFPGVLALVLFAFLAGAPSPAAAWGRVGHQVIANVAQARLSPQARREVARLLRSATLASVASDADAWRNNHPETFRWHFVNIPIDVPAYDPDRHCEATEEGDCVIAEIDRLSVVLRDRSRPDAERAQALAFLVHFVGDVHNPMHASDNNDRGGNGTKVTFLGRPTNLHAVWDSGLLEATGLTITALTGQVERLPQAVNTASGPVAWAEEAHDVARDVAYALPADRELGEPYVEVARPAAEVQLLRAGVRLAALLNELFG